ncbi:MAG: hypothetical protein R3C68_13870 [Myxococcota bacterium]
MKTDLDDQSAAHALYKLDQQVERVEINGKLVSPEDARAGFDTVNQSVIDAFDPKTPVARAVARLPQKMLDMKDSAVRGMRRGAAWVGLSAYVVSESAKSTRPGQWLAQHQLNLAHVVSRPQEFHQGPTVKQASGFGRMRERTKQALKKTGDSIHKYLPLDALHADAEGVVHHRQGVAHFRDGRTQAFEINVRDIGLELTLRRFAVSAPGVGVIPLADLVSHAGAAAADLGFLLKEMAHRNKVGARACFAAFFKQGVLASVMWAVPGLVHHFFGAGAAIMALVVENGASSGALAGLMSLEGSRPKKPWACQLWMSLNSAKFFRLKQPLVTYKNARTQ